MSKFKDFTSVMARSKGLILPEKILRENLKKILLKSSDPYLCTPFKKGV